MFIELIATFVAGIACAGLAMLINRIIGQRLPRWIVPVAAGLGMFGTTIANEYTWYTRTADSLPEGLHIAQTVEEQSWLRPWTQAFPYTKRFVAIDVATARHHPNVPDQRLADLYFFGRWSPVNKAPMLFDCAGGRTALLIDGAQFAEDGTISNADWRGAPEHAPLLQTACRGV